MEENYDGPILIVKTAWGGKSLHIEYRSPSSGTYTLPEELTKKLEKKGNGALEKIQAETKEFTGKYYRYMIDHVKKVLNDIDRVYPEYDESVVPSFMRKPDRRLPKRCLN